MTTLGLAPFRTGHRTVIRMSCLRGLSMCRMTCPAC